MAKGVACGERIISVLERKPAIVDAPNAVPAPPFRGELAFDRVSFGYGDGPDVLSHVSFVAKPGTRVALVGESGAGKSTLAKLLLRLADPRHGSVRIDGRDVREFTIDSLRNSIAIVPQEALLFATTIRENIAFGRLDATEEEILAAARLANADEFIRKLPEGYDTEVGERGVTLSGGERQRIAIARAAVRRSPILILDEPMTGLDAQSEAAVKEALERLSEGRTTVLIAHRFTLVERCDLILVLENGRIAESGTAPELRSRDGLFRRLAALQTEGAE
jgi:ATP-binding cassette subfamily B protein